MIYLIGGVPRTGKSRLAALMLQRNLISCISTDVLRNFLDHSPAKVGIGEAELAKRPEAFAPYLYTFLRILQNKYEDYVVEGDIFTPEQVKVLQEKVALKCVFLGFSEVTLQDLRHRGATADWVARLSEAEQGELPGRF